MKTINRKMEEKLVSDKYVVGYVTTKQLDEGRKTNIHISETNFRKGSFTHWHTYPNVQILIGKIGIGFIQKKDEKPIRIIHGDAVIIQANEEHWHGARENGNFIHTTIQLENDKGIVIRPLTRSEYNIINNL